MDSYTGLGAGVAMTNMMTGEVIFGGPGSGLYGMLLLVVLGVFIAGMMVGRSPEYLGKQIQAHEVKLASVGSLFVPLLVLALFAQPLSSHMLGWARRSQLLHAGAEKLHVALTSEATGAARPRPPLSWRLQLRLALARAVASPGSVIDDLRVAPHLFRTWICRRCRERTRGHRVADRRHRPASAVWMCSIPGGGLMITPESPVRPA